MNAIRSATEYTDEYLKHGSACDSSDRRHSRISVVLNAERAFVQKHQREILDMAANDLEIELCGAKATITEDEVMSEHEDAVWLEHKSRLEQMIDDDCLTWDLSEKDKTAISGALERIFSLESELTCIKGGGP